MEVTFIGHSSCIPDVGREMACFLIDGKHLVDAGWCAALKMREYGFDPTGLESIIFTHMHQDHYLGLPQLLFYIAMRRHSENAGPLHLVGPGEHLGHVVRSAAQFLQCDRFPELAVEYRLASLAPGDTYDLGDILLETCAARHTSGHNRPEPALVYKVTDRQEGATFAFTGDTHTHPPIADFVRGVPLLIHDGAHTPAAEAAAIARSAGVDRLLLIHYLERQAAGLLAAAREVFPNTDLAEEGLTVQV